jgi:hypothetical protein
MSEIFLNNKWFKIHEYYMPMSANLIFIVKKEELTEELKYNIENIKSLILLLHDINYSQDFYYDFIDIKLRIDFESFSYRNITKSLKYRHDFHHQNFQFFYKKTVKLNFDPRDKSKLNEYRLLCI